ncbi:MAG: HAMP domain-containing histidine kinase [Lachnospiraceae bacterium]|nr:HAMP domain-containing histidine kinase [Lachnospiraceae bacterium]
MKKNRKLYAKFILAYFCFAALSVAVVLIITAPITYSFLVRQKAAELYRSANEISNTYAGYFYDNSLSTEDVRKQLKASGDFSFLTIWIMNTDGEVIYDSAADDQNRAGFTIEGFVDEDTSRSFYREGNFYGYFSEDMLSVLSPITNNYNLKGYVVIHSPLTKIREQRNDLILIVLATLAVVFVLSTIILVVFTDIVYIPLKKITKATEAYAEGDFTYPIDIDKNDEIGYLAASLTYMADKVSHLEDDQKKFIANVSHDFRSPLTSMKGYLEAMADGTIPPEQHEKYLKIVKNETERLTKLTNNLLTLNNLNITGMNLDITDFDINRTIRNTVATFEGICKTKHISFNLVLTGETLFVSADKGRIEQVLYNLIDNAIKFSKPDSQIKLETSEKNETIFVSVKDSGIGIPKDDLKLIFDRFYKTDQSRGRDKKGTGLGLSIVKEIINAHHENINVISTVDVGTEFIFTLPKSKNVADDD